jgi:hypothetical protein
VDQIRLDTIVNKLNCFFGRDIAFSAGSENHDVVGPLGEEASV